MVLPGAPTLCLDRQAGQVGRLAMVEPGIGLRAGQTRSNIPARPTHTMRAEGRRGAMSRMAAAAIVLALGGCAGSPQENQAVGQLHGQQQAIENYYNRYATEEDWNCNEVQMSSIVKSSVVDEREDAVKLAVHYYFQSEDLTRFSGSSGCQGFGTRVFSFSRGPDGALTLVSMSGPQRRA
jgi:hypothetical protein